MMELGKGKMQSNNQIKTLKEKIHDLRGQRVILDRDLADLLGVETKSFNQTVKRNIEKFSFNAMF